MDILFTPVGNTDPISMYNEKEGSILHICRKYKPDKVYLYMSKEIIEHHEKDNRYIKSLEELYKGIGKDFEYEIIKREELIDVHFYDYFYKDFKEILNSIYKDYPEGKVYLNVSSGTPGMKNALFILSNFLNYKTIPIQVGTPIKRSNINVDNYDPEVYNLVIQELNENPDSFVDRTIKPEIDNLNYELKKEIIINHINKYNYSAALTTAETIRDFLSDKVYYMIRAAVERIQLKRSVMISTLSKVGESFEIYHGKNELLIEYLLYLDTTIKRGLLLEFIRGISPGIFELFIIFLDNNYNINIDDYTDTRRKDKIRYWSRDTLKRKENQIIDKVLNNKYANFRYNSYVKSDHLLCIIESPEIVKSMKIKPPSGELYETISQLRKIERDARNIAAHEIISIDDNYLKRATNYTSEEIYNLLKELVKGVGLNVSRDNWNSYELMNEKIKNSLD